MTSAVDVCNSALNLVGANNITSLTEDSKAARVCNQRYEFVRDNTFRAHPWNCLITRKSLAQDATTPVYKYAYRYTLPTDPYCLRVLSVSDDGDAERYDIDYQLEAGRYLLTDEGTMNIRYIGRLTDPTEWDIGLVETIAARLASDIAYPLIGSSSFAQDMFAMYEMKLKDARHSDATEGYPDAIIADTYTASRF